MPQPQYPLYTSTPTPLPLAGKLALAAGGAVCVLFGSVGCAAIIINATAPPQPAPPPAAEEAIEEPEEEDEPEEDEEEEPEDDEEEEDEPEEEDEEEEEEDDTEERQEELMNEVEALVIADCEHWQDQDPSLDDPDFTPYCWYDPDQESEFAVSDDEGYVIIHQSQWGATNPPARTTLDLACGEVDGFEGVESRDGVDSEAWSCDDDRPAM